MMPGRTPMFGRCFRRCLTGNHSNSDAFKRILQFKDTPLTETNLSTLIRFGSDVSFTNDDREFRSSAEFCHSELPVRIAHILDKFHHLPYIVMNDHMKKVYDVYTDSLVTLANMPKPSGREDDMEFTELLRDLDAKEATVIQDLARGVKKAHGMVDMESFVNQFLLARISCRLIASQQIITQDFKFGMNNNRNGGIDLHTMPAHTIRRCSNIVQTISDRVYGTHPNIKIMGHLDSTLAYVPAHLEYMVNEILKNAVRATMDRQVALKIKEGGKGASIQDALDAVRRGGAEELPKIRCVISKGKRYLSIKISDSGGGVEEEDIRDIWKWAFSTRDKLANDGTSMGDYHPPSEMKELAGYGIGLPLARLYARYFGGDLRFFSMFDYGTDVGITVNHIGDFSSMNKTDHLSRLLDLGMGLGTEKEDNHNRIGYTYRTSHSDAV